MSDTSLNWFPSYLLNRTQRVSVNNVLSEHRYICYGVPQGSILGPLLLLIFINHFPLYTNNVTIYLYADDTTLFDINNDTLCNTCLQTQNVLRISENRNCLGMTGRKKKKTLPGIRDAQTSFTCWKHRP